MPIPDYQSLMLPLLRLAGDKQEHSVRDAIEQLAQEFQLTEGERKELLPSGQEFVFGNRVGWARTYLKKAGLLEYSKSGYFNITKRGLEALSENPSRIDIKVLDRYPEFFDFRSPKKAKVPEPNPANGAIKQTPEESIEHGYQGIREELAEELLNRIKSCSPAFFERLVVELLVKMGYGGSRKDAGEAIGGSGDGGIDGIIKEDKLGLDVIYVQAKKWNGNVGRPEIQKFVGALAGQKARKGIFITTSTFTGDAVGYASGIDNKVVLIDGSHLSQLMIDNDIGVSRVAIYEIKKIDSDYFTDE